MASDAMKRPIDMGDRVAIAVVSKSSAELRFATVLQTSEDSITVFYESKRPDSYSNRKAGRVGHVYKKKWTTHNLQNVILLQKD